MDDISRLKQRNQRKVINTTITPLSLPTAQLQTQSANMWEGIARSTQAISDELEKQAQEQRVLTLAQTEISADIQATRLRGEYEYNPQGFESAWEEYTADVLKNTPGELMDQTRLALEKEFAQRLGPIENEARSRQRQLAIDTLNTKAEATQNKLLNMAFDNETANPEYEAAYAEYASVLQSSANLGLRSQEAADIELDAFSDRLKAEAVIGKIGSTYEQEGYEAAKTLLNDTVGNENFNFTQQDRAGLMRRGLSVINTLEAEREKEITEVRAVNKANLDLRISRLGTPLEEGGESIDSVYQTIQSANYLTPSEKSNFLQAVDTKLIKQIEEKQNDTFVEGVLQGGLIDRNNKDQNKAVNEYFNNNIAPALADKTLGEYFDEASSFVRKTQIVPDAVQSSVRGMLYAGTPAQQVLAADFIQKIDQTAPLALSDFGEKAIEKADFLSTVAQGSETPEEALRLYAESTKVNPNIESYRKKVSRDEEHIKKNKRFLRQVSDRFDLGTGIRGVEIPDAMQAEYNAMQNRLYLNTGNLEASQESAWKMLQRQWAETTTGGPKRWMRHAPERYVGAGEWVQEQLVEDIKAIKPDIDSSRIRIMADEFTEREASSGVPSYQVFIINDDGVPEPLFNRNPLYGQNVEGWRPEFSSSEAFIKSKEEERAAMEAGSYNRKLRKQSRAAETLMSPSMRVTHSILSGFINDMRALGYKSGVESRLENERKE